MAQIQGRKLYARYKLQAELKKQGVHLIHEQVIEKSSSICSANLVYI